MVTITILIPSAQVLGPQDAAILGEITKTATIILANIKLHTLLGGEASKIYTLAIGAGEKLLACKGEGGWCMKIPDLG